MKKIILFAFAALMLAACGKTDKPSDVSVTGEWELKSITTKSAKLGDLTIDVYVGFKADGSFELFQNKGEGHYRKYTGKYKLENSVLSGSYSDGKAFGTTYDVTVEGETLTLAPVGTGEVQTFKKSSIPQSVRDNALVF